MNSFLKTLTTIAACAIILLLTYTTTTVTAAAGAGAQEVSDFLALSQNETLNGSSTNHLLNRLLNRQKRQGDEHEEIIVGPRGAEINEDPVLRKSDAHEIQTCSQGLVLPLWVPQSGLTWGDRAVRGIVYFLLLIYLFVGVSIISDRFMAAIEAITSTEKNVSVKGPNGERKYVTVRIWNETVANLTLMALGSSAPEILLSVIEIYAKNFEAGDLGPGTIVGSAAYNLFIIVAVCMVAIPKGQVRRILHLRVFCVTATFSILAYVWLWIILAIITPGVIQMWESVFTFMGFPLLVVWAYCAEKRMLVYKYLDKNYRLNKRGVVVGSDRDNVEMGPEKTRHHHATAINFPRGHDSDAEAFEDARREYITVLSELRAKYPEADLEQLEAMAQEQMISRGSKSRAFYRVQATRKMIGSGNLMRKIQERAHSDLTEVKAQLQQMEEDEEDDTPIRIYFEPGHYTVMENCGEFEVRVVRRGDISKYSSVDYATQDGTAIAGTDYIGKAGTLTFPPGVDEQRFKIEVIDDDIFEEDECFYIRLFNPSDYVTLTIPQTATVMILDDDHGGIFAFANANAEISESVGIFDLVVMRYSGARGGVIVPYWTEDDTAKAGKDYEPMRGELHFENNCTEQYITIPILEESSYEKNVAFKVHIGEPRLAPDDEFLAEIHNLEKKKPQELTELERVLLLSKPRNGEITTVRVNITESKEFKATVDKLVAKANVSAVLGTSSWKEQFRDALTVVPIDESEFDNEEDAAEEEVPGCFEYISHFICLFWKVLFAFVPPTDICGGYVTFVVAIFIIGVLTAVIGDAANYFGCALNIKDSVTAICFVALGTSIPDTFASLIAAKQDSTADNSIGNVTGSNAVNVFLGIGLAWSCASIYHYSKGSVFYVEPGAIGFAVALFCAEALVAIALMMYRRYSSISAELGGPTTSKWTHATILVLLWVFYLVISTLEAYDVFGNH